jgi:hypothetical protein
LTTKSISHPRASGFVKVVASLMPRELLVGSMAADLGDDELDTMITRLREQLAKPQEQPLLIEGKVVANDKEPVAVNGSRPVE